jgi:hypothetical protein
MPYWPLGLVTTTSHEPGVASDGGEKVQEIRVEDCTLILLAVIFGLSLFISVTVAPLWKFVPVRSVMEITVPAVPSSGIMFLMDGFAADETVVLVAVTVVVVDKVTVVAEVAGVCTGIDAGALLVIFAVYTFSMSVLL